MINDIVLEFHWSNNPIPIEQLLNEPDFIFEIPFGLITGFDAPVQSVNGKIGAVTLNHDDVGADATGSAEAVQQSVNALSTTVNQVLTLAQTNEMKIGTRADQVDLETAEQQIELNRLAILTKADIAALSMLAQLVDTKADQAYVNQQIANLVGSAPEALNTVYELAAAIQDNAGIIDTLNQSVANRVRFDVATQALTEIQKQNARTNIGAETLGTAATLVAAITAASIGAATAAQGSKADTALQSGDVALVALTGLFSSLSGQNKIYDVVFGAYALGSNAAIAATDTLGQIIGKLQAQINSSKTFDWVDVTSIAGAQFAPVGVTLDMANTKIFIAKKDGNLWLKGYFRLAANISAPSAGVVLRITDLNWLIDADPNVQAFPASWTLYHPIQPASCFIQLTTTQMDFTVKGNASSGGWGYVIYPTCIGKAK